MVREKGRAYTHDYSTKIREAIYAYMHQPRRCWLVASQLGLRTARVPVFPSTHPCPRVYIVPVSRRRLSVNHSIGEIHGRRTGDTNGVCHAPCTTLPFVYAGAYIVTQFVNMHPSIGRTHSWRDNNAYLVEYTAGEYSYYAQVRLQINYLAATQLLKLSIDHSIGRNHSWRTQCHKCGGPQSLHVPVHWVYPHIV